jgi:hypothetical protein
MTAPQTVLVPSNSLPLPQVDLFSALGYTPQPLTHDTGGFVQRSRKNSPLHNKKRRIKVFASTNALEFLII